MTFFTKYKSAAKPFSNYAQGVKGGTEYMAQEFLKRIEDKVPNLSNYNCIVIPGVINGEEHLYDGRKLIIWLHNTLNQFNGQVIDLFKSEKFQDNVKFIITVSEYHKQKTIDQCGIDPDKVIVIENAIEDIPFNKSKFNDVEKVKLIHASSPDRAMDVLLAASQMVEEDFELRIFNNFNPDIDQLTPKMKELLDADDRIIFYGKTPRKTVLKYFAESHAHVYPSLWEETSCITQIEAMVSGNFCLYSKIGSLEETSRGFGEAVTFKYEDIEKDAATYAERLTALIKSIKQGKLDFDPEKQSREIYNYFSWDAAAKRWQDLNDRLAEDE